MKRKIGLLILWLISVIVCGFAIWKFDEYDCGLGEAIASALIALFIQRALEAAFDLTDTTDWKSSQRKLKRGGFINDRTIIRVSFAYLYRIKVEGKYLLVKNTRNTGKYQPVGGVYKFKRNEKMELKNRFQVMDDNKILIDESSRDDYRLRMENRYLREFVRRFNGKSERERIENLGREFKEELIETGILDWSQITYRVCGRHMTELKFGEHFQIYELLLADVIELIPTDEQETDLKKLVANSSDNRYRFATAERIMCLGIDTNVDELYEWIGDHAKKVLQEEESNLMKIPEVGKKYTVTF